MKRELFTVVFTGRLISAILPSFSPAPSPEPGTLFLSRIPGVHRLGKYFTVSTNFHFLHPTSLGLSLADRPIYEPAQVPHVKFPGRAGFPILRGTIPNIPAGAGIPGISLFGAH